jgi:2-keto-3-deoxy-6-phosphogluconate aldolase
MYNADQVELCPDSGATVISAANSKNLFLTLKENGSEILKCIPANKLNPALNNGILFALNGQQIDWTESKVFAKGSISASSAFMVIEYAE